MTAGMGGKALVVVGQRMLLSYALEPLRHLKEHLEMPPAKPAAGR